MSADIIRLVPQTRGTRGYVRELRSPDADAPLSPPNYSRLRAERKAAWKHAEIAMHYLERLLDFVTWCEIAQERGVAEALKHQPVKDSDRMTAAEKLHESTRVLLLTPAPDRAAVNWKICRRRRGGLFALGNASPDAVDRAIADDEAFLAAHPARKGGAKVRG
jgi:hypothetical protein